MPGEQTKRVEVLSAEFAGYRELVQLKFDELWVELKRNSKDTKATKRLLVSLLVSTILCMGAVIWKGCAQ